MLTRREFIRLCTTVTAGFTLSDLLLGEIIPALAAPEQPPVLWVQAATCTGDTLSFTNTVNPYLSRVITKLVDLRYHSNLNGAFGERALRVIEETSRRGDFILVWEGAVPTKEEGLYGTIGERRGHSWTMLDVARELAPRARAIIAVGVCATSGGPFAAAPNPAGCKGLHQVIRESVINCPGCPCHPDWFVGTLAHLLLYGGPPALDKFNRPLLFYGKLIHDLCPRRQFFDNGIFAQYPGDFGCLYKVGCKGPVTYADCPIRKWNEYVNWPVEDNTPCIGCANPGFPDATEPFFQHLPQVRSPYLTVKANTIGVAAGAATTAAIGTHLVGNLIAKRPLGGRRKKDGEEER